MPADDSPSDDSGQHVDVDVDVVVVGAGVSGLVTAMMLRRHGLTCRVIEARDRIGGRVVGVPGYEAADLGPAWYWPHHPHVAQLLGEVGLASFVQPSGGETIVDAGPGRVPQRHSRSEPGPTPFRVVGGVTALVRALADGLADDVILLSSPVEHIELADDGIRVREKEGEVLTARACVVAVPPALASRAIRLSPPLDRARAQLMEATPTWMSWSMKVALVYEGAPWQRDGLSGAGLSHVGPILQVYDASEPDAYRKGGPGVLIGWVDPDSVRTLSVVERREQVEAQVARMYGLPAPVAYAEQDWSAEPFTSIPRGLPFGSIDVYGHHRLREPMWDGRLHFSASETSEVSPGYLDGAIARGRQVAYDVAARLGVR